MLPRAGHLQEDRRLPFADKLLGFCEDDSLLVVAVLVVVKPFYFVHFQ
jgi:hypothetical protein